MKNFKLHPTPELKAWTALWSQVGIIVLVVSLSILMHCMSYYSEVMLGVVFSARNLNRLKRGGKLYKSFASTNSGLFSSNVHLRHQKHTGRHQLNRSANLRTVHLQAVLERHIKSAELLKSKVKIMKLETPAFQEIFTPELNLLVELFKKYGHELRIAGGAVRDLMLGNIPHDIDFATTATPDEMKALFEKENIRILNTHGESHGTITCRINDKVNLLTR